MRSRLVVAFLVGILSIGCASTDTVRQAQGQGMHQVYARPYDVVFDATLAAAGRQELAIVESNKATGAIVLSHGVTLLSWGERIAVFVKANGTGATDVEIVSKPVLAPLNFPPEWDRILLRTIGEELERR